MPHLKSIIFILSLITFALSSVLCISPLNEDQPSSVFGKLKSGLKLAGKLLGLDAASEVAKLVTESFAKPSRKGDTAQTGPGIFSGFFRLLGLESTKIGAIAVNALVFLAQLISSSLARPSPPELVHVRKLRSGSPYDWIMENIKLKEILDAAKDPELAEYVINNLKERASDEQTGCVQLLICKSTPFLQGMQKAISGTKESETPAKKATGKAALISYLPTLEELADNGDDCEDRYPSCYLDI